MPQRAPKTSAAAATGDAAARASPTGTEIARDQFAIDRLRA